MNRIGLLTFLLAAALVAPPARLAAIPLLPGETSGPLSVRIDGFEEFGYCGYDNSPAGDVNGDGYADIIFSSPGSTFNGSDSGSVYVLFGNQLRYLDLANPGTLPGFRIDGAAASDWLGESVSTAGDINGDGYSDVIMGASDASNNGRAYSGSAYVIFGKSSGFANIDLASLAPAAGFRIDGAEANDHLGTAVRAAGDVNGDGYADVMVAAFRAGNNGRTESGSVYVLFGKASGFSDIDLAQPLDLANGFRIDGAVAYDWCGRTLADPGDMNGDGYDDIVVAAPESNSAGVETGTAYVIFGKPSWTSSIDLATPSSTYGFKIDGAAIDYRRFGSSISPAGDYNGDGYADVAMTQSYANDSGTIHVFLGKPDGWADMNIASFNSSHGFRIIGGDFSWCGVQLHYGSFDGDGCSDIMFWAYTVLHVLHGKASPISDIDLSLDHKAIPYIDLRGVGPTTVSNAGDVNGDGFSEIIVAAVANERDEMSWVGTTYVLFPNAQQATYTQRLLGGDRPRTAMGADRDGLPKSLVWLDYDGGDVSTETVTLYSRLSFDDPVAGITPEKDTSHLYWHVTTTRTGWSTATLTIRYPASAEPYEGDLRIYQSATSSGPWTRLDTTINTARHEVSATVTSMSWFALGKANVLPLGLSWLSVE